MVLDSSGQTSAGETGTLLVECDSVKEEVGASASTVGNFCSREATKEVVEHLPFFSNIRGTSCLCFRA